VLVRHLRPKSIRSWFSEDCGQDSPHVLGFICPKSNRESAVPRRSAGLLLFRRSAARDLEVLIVHPGGPLFARKDDGVWSVPKGEYEPDDDPLTEACREFAEEVGSAAPDGERIDLGSVTQRGGKVVSAWAVAGDLDTSKVKSNEFEMEWPPRSGVRRRFPEIDRAEWVGVAEARRKLVGAQVELVERLEGILAARATSEPDAT
jgi:predicted NUDIX family NTP pyrophosphohydrolase